MSVELLRNLSTGSYVAAIVLGVVAIILFLALRIPAVVGDLTGVTARRAIEDIRLQNAGAYRPRRKSTRNERQKMDTVFQTENLNPSNSTTYAHERSSSGETTLLSQAGETTQLSQAGETTLLTGETTPLSSAGEASPAFHVDVDLGFAASTETID